MLEATVGICSDPVKRNDSRGNGVEGEWINTGGIMEVKSVFHGNSSVSCRRGSSSR